MTRVAVCGGLSVDHLVVAPRAAEFDRLGGPGLYAALGARLVAGTEVRLHAGLPLAAPEFTTTLRGAGVDLAHCTTVADVPRVWILNSEQGRRIVSTTPPPGLELDAPERAAEPEYGRPPPALLRGIAGVLYCAPRSIRIPPAGVVAGVDPDQREVLRRAADYWRAIAVPGGVLLPSRVQLAGLGADPRIAAQRLASVMGVAVAARLDVDGAYAVDPAGRCWTIRDEHVEVVDTTGAGDTGAGAIVAALAGGADLPTAAALGVSASRVVLSDWGHTALIEHPPLTGPLPGVRVTSEGRS